MLTGTKCYRWAWLVLVTALYFMLPSAVFAQAEELDGLWLQIDDRSGRPLSVIRMQTEGALAFGWVEKIFLPPGMQPPLCMRCQGDKAGKPITGMHILSASRSDALEWSGEILDPESGRVYKGRLELAADGKLVKLRGYVGIPLFGRTQIWRRFGSI